MTINRYNYNKYLLEYLNGDLDLSLSNELVDFLSANPDLEKQILNTNSNDINSAPFPDKNKLKRNFSDIPKINESNFDEFCIADVEGLLDDYNRQRLSDFVLHHDKEKDYSLYEKTLLHPDLKIVFPDKLLLKKKTIFPPFIQSIYFKIAIAAAAVLLILLINPFTTSNKGKFADHLSEKNHASVSYIDSTINFVPDIINSYPDTLITNKHKKTKVSYRLQVKNHSIQTKDTFEIPPLLHSIHPLFTNAQAIQDNLIITQYLKTASNTIPSYDSAYTVISDKTFADIQQFIKKVDIRKTPETIVKVFNYLTESNIGLYSSFDNNGKLTGLEIKTDIFSFETGKKN
jgi:hypothetical protein